MSGARQSFLCARIRISSAAATHGLQSIPVLSSLGGLPCHLCWKEEAAPWGQVKTPCLEALVNLAGSGSLRLRSWRRFNKKQTWHSTHVRVQPQIARPFCSRPFVLLIQIEVPYLIRKTTTLATLNPWWPASSILLLQNVSTGHQVTSKVRLCILDADKTAQGPATRPCTCTEAFASICLFDDADRTRRGRSKVPFPTTAPPIGAYGSTAPQHSIRIHSPSIVTAVSLVRLRHRLHTGRRFATLQPRQYKGRRGQFVAIFWAFTRSLR
ncbi:hypothetical protein BD289DRAFT_195003 [Coniella lustricola]|uniref:Uncharacterized protein n=1 Tax=Coniella lustricola TaxID=2025994 RepID=A0A2T3AM37_9PEZI|nr:hypothetical protein BD289DRAFT_195003 [Coniella lustricola]